MRLDKCLPFGNRGAFECLRPITNICVHQVEMKFLQRIDITFTEAVVDHRALPETLNRAVPQPSRQLVSRHSEELADLRRRVTTDRIGRCGPVRFLRHVSCLLFGSLTLGQVGYARHQGTVSFPVPRGTCPSASRRIRLPQLGGAWSSSSCCLYALVDLGTRVCGCCHTWRPFFCWSGALAPK